ncbi:MAG: CBS domain-containing protein [Alphaproteobacteria bacterium]
MTVAAILRSKGRDVATIAPDATVETAVAALAAKRIGALVVSLDGRTGIGILSERDVVRVLSERGARALAMPVSAAMTAPIRTCCVEDGVPAIMVEMTRHRVRHLPVIENGQLAGIVSIGDVVKRRLDDLESESSAMREYIAGR